MRDVGASPGGGEAWEVMRRTRVAPESLTDALQRSARVFANHPAVRLTALRTGDPRAADSLTELVGVP